MLYYCLNVKYRLLIGWKKDGRRDFTAMPFHLDLLIRSSRALASNQEKKGILAKEMAEKFYVVWQKIDE